MNTIVAAVTDNTAITLKWEEDVKKPKKELGQHWKISDLGELKWYLGLCVWHYCANRTISVNQQAYIKAMLDRFNLSLAKPIAMLMDPGVKFSKNQCPTTPTQIARMCGVPYTEGIGSVLWPLMISHLKSAFIISTLAQFVQNPGKVHWEVLKQVMAYLGTMKPLWLMLGDGSLTKPIMKGLCNVDWTV